MLARKFPGDTADNTLRHGVSCRKHGQIRLQQVLERVVAFAQPIEGIERVKVYNASISWDDPSFQLEGFYRTGHYHWGHEGDFFGLYREANYGQNIDIYNGEAPFGFEMTGKRRFAGWKLAYGQELWWGANPAAILKYRRAIAGVGYSLPIHSGKVAGRNANCRQTATRRSAPPGREA